MMYSRGRYGVMDSTLRAIHPRFQTPYVALALGAMLNCVLCVAFVRNAEIDTFGWYGTLASYGFILVYGLCSIAAPVYLRKTGELTPGTVAFGAAGTILMALSLVGSLYPVPAYPLNLLPYLFALYMRIGAAWFFTLKAKAPAALLHIEHDLEVADIPLGAKML